MIISRVEGGLGNQLFIYACGRALALREKREFVLDIFNAGYGGTDPFQRDYQLGRFPIRARLARPEERKRFRRNSRSFYWLRKASRWLPLKWKPILEEIDEFDAGLLTQSLSNPLYLVGYWQDERYFLDSAEDIASELSPAHLNNLVKDDDLRLVSSEDVVVLHVRREKFPHKLSADYYFEAFKALRLQDQRMQFVVFGDGFDWARETLRLPRTTIFMSHNRVESNLADFYLMTCAKRLIIANSTFSWWAAWFAGRNGAEVVAPAVWGYPAKPSLAWNLVLMSRYRFD